MEYYNNMPVVTYNDVQDIICMNTLNSLFKRGQIKRIRRAHNGYSALFSVDSFPLKYRKAIKEKFGEFMKENTTNNLLSEEQITRDMQAVKYFGEYVLADGRHLSEDKQEEYVNNASILNRCQEIYVNSCEMRNRTSGKKVNKGEFWKKVSEKLPELQEELPNSLPMDVMRLRKKYNDYRKRGYEAMISGKFMNKNNKKVNDEQKESVMITLLSDRRNLQDTQIAMIYNEVAKRMKWKEVTEGTVKNWRKKYELESYAGRYGENKFRANKTMQVKRTRPEESMMYWTADSWDVELLYQKTQDDKKGHSVTTYHNRLTVCVILDTSINYPVGYAIGEYETPKLIRQALRDAVNHTKDLFGKRYIVNEFQCDRYAFKTLKETYKGITKNFVPARAHNAKAKVIEPYFKYLNDKYCHLEGNWSGYGVTSRRELQPGEYPTAIKKMFPNEEECAEQIARIMEKEREAKQEEFKKGFNDVPEEKRIEIKQEQYLLLFGEDNNRTNKLEGSGLNIKIEGKKRHYDCFDLEFRRHSYEDWTIKYDKENLSKVLAVNKDRSLQFMLEEKHLQPMALEDRKMGDSEKLQKVFDFNKSIERHVTEVVCTAQERTKDLILRNAGKMDETLSKLMLTDSRGQHKDRRNANRMISEEEIEKTEFKAVDFDENTKDEEEESLASLY